MNKNRPEISAELNDIINGYLMGDGYINGNGSLQVDQGKNQKAFVEWLFEPMKILCTDICQIKPTYEKTTGKIKSYRFFTRAWLKDYHLMWYQPVEQDGKIYSKKILPKNIEEMFTPLFITVWFACDGTKTKDYRGARFEVTAFSLEERLRLKQLFLEKYQIDVNIVRNGTSKKGTPLWALSIHSKEYDKFYQLITQNDLLLNYFSYKLHKKPRQSL